MNVNIIVNEHNRHQIQNIKDKIVQDLFDYLIKDLINIIIDYCFSYDRSRITIKTKGVNENNVICYNNEKINEEIKENSDCYFIEFVNPLKQVVSSYHNFTILLLWFDQRIFQTHIIEDLNPLNSITLIDNKVYLQPKDIHLKSRTDFLRTILSVRNVNMIVYDFKTDRHYSYNLTHLAFTKSLFLNSYVE